MRSFVRLLLILTSVAAGQAQQQSADFPQWRGPNRDGAAPSFTPPRAWPDKLTPKWRVEVGLGYATPILVGSRVFMFSRVADDEVMRAIDGDSGKTIWESRYPAPFSMNPAAARHTAGPKSTPTFADGRLFTLGMSGIVSAWDAASGKRLWQTAPPEVHPLYHTAMSPLVDRGLVIVHVGGHNKGALTAFDSATGAVRWQWAGDGPAYNSPIVAEFGGTRQVITFTQDNLIGVAAASGELLWRRPYQTRATQNTITPILYNNTVIISGLSNPVVAFTITRSGAEWRTQNVWENPDQSLYMTNAVLVGDTLVGMTHRNSGQFFGLDARTGKTIWTSEPRQATNAAILRAGAVTFALKDDGELLVLENSATGFTPLRRYEVADSATWSLPSVSGNRMFVKDQDSLALFTFE
jgi:outer membrane protein assembly factor BamB